MLRPSALARPRCSRLRPPPRRPMLRPAASASASRCVVLHQLAGLDGLRLVVRVRGLVGERHLEVALGGGESLRGHVRETGHEELAALRGGSDLLLLVLLQLLLALLDEAELLLP